MGRSINGTVPSPGQYYTLVSIGMPSSLLSFVCSAAIARSAWKAPKNNVYQKLVLQLSLADALSSLGIFFHPFGLPREFRDYGLLWASGNSATCTVFGAAVNAGPTLVSFYNLYLSAYFLAKVKYNIQDGVILKKRMLLIGNIVAVFLSMSLATAGASIQAFRPQSPSMVCTYGECAIGYSLDECQEDGNPMGALLGTLNGMLVTITSISAIVVTVLIYLSVRKKLLQSGRFVFGTSTRSTSTRQQQQKNKNLVATRNQAILYSVAFWNSFFWFFATAFLVLARGELSEDDEPLWEDSIDSGVFVYVAFGYVFIPVQGFLNFLVYTRPRYIEWRTANEHRNRLYSLWKAISLEPVSATAHLEKRMRMKQKAAAAAAQSNVCAAMDPSTTANSVSMASDTTNSVRESKFGTNEDSRQPSSVFLMDSASSPRAIDEEKEEELSETE